MFDTVSIIKCGSYDNNLVKDSLDRALEGIGALDLIKPGMKIGIKTNLVSGIAPEKAVTTHPAVLKRLCELLAERGAEVVIGDSPGGIYTQSFVNNAYKAAGLTEMVDKLHQEGVTAVSLNQDFSISNGVFDEAVSLKTFIYTGWLDKVDAIINVSKLKTHAMMGMSCAVKNMFGTIPGTTKPEYHMRFPDELAFANIMVDLNEYFKPVLYVVDAIDGMEGNGPTAGEKRHIGAVLASKRPYALDMVCAELINMKLEDAPTLRAAYERKLGPAGVAAVTLTGDCTLEEIRIPDFKRATVHQSITFETESLWGRLSGKVMKMALNTRPQVKVDECIGCKKCFETCPAHAITMVDTRKVKNKIPQIDRSKCIKCFCCQEFCPKGAMKVHHNLLGSIVQKVNTR